MKAIKLHHIKRMYRCKMIFLVMRTSTAASALVN